MIKKFIKKLIDIYKFLTAPCNPPYDCPWCMDCYNNPKEIGKEYGDD